LLALSRERVSTLVHDPVETEAHVHMLFEKAEHAHMMMMFETAAHVHTCLLMPVPDSTKGQRRVPSSRRPSSIQNYKGLEVYPLWTATADVDLNFFSAALKEEVSLFTEICANDRRGINLCSPDK
jgi:hypothetical protein